MNIQLDFEKDLKRVERELGRAHRKIVAPAASSALNRTAREARTNSARELMGSVGKALGLSVSGFKKTIKLKRARVRNLIAALVVSGSALPLARFGARKTAKGVSAAPWGKRRVHKGAFIAKMPSGRRGVFKRTSKNRLPIKELWGPSIPRVFLEGDVQRSLKHTINTNWPKNFAHEIRYRLRKFNRG